MPPGRHSNLCSYYVVCLLCFNGNYWCYFWWKPLACWFSLLYWSCVGTWMVIYQKSGYNYLAFNNRYLVSVILWLGKLAGCCCFCYRSCCQGKYCWNNSGICCNCLLCMAVVQKAQADCKIGGAHVRNNYRQFNTSWYCGCYYSLDGKNKTFREKFMQLRR